MLDEAVLFSRLQYNTEQKEKLQIVSEMLNGGNLFANCNATHFASNKIKSNAFCFNGGELLK